MPAACYFFLGVSYLVFVANFGITVILGAAKIGTELLGGQSAPQAGITPGQNVLRWRSHAGERATPRFLQFLWLSCEIDRNMPVKASLSSSLPPSLPSWGWQFPSAASTAWCVTWPPRPPQCAFLLRLLVRFFPEPLSLTTAQSHSSLLLWARVPLWRKIQWGWELLSSGENKTQRPKRFWQA